MVETIGKLAEIAALSMFKFAFGAFLGAKLGTSFLFTFLASVGGMNLSVLIFSFFGLKIKKLITSIFYKKKKKLFTPGNRRIVTVWMKYGLIGIAFLTPPLFTPPVGTLVASGFGEPRQRIVLFMLISSIFWGIVFCYAAYQLKEVPFLKRILG